MACRNPFLGSHHTLKILLKINAKWYFLQMYVKLTADVIKILHYLELNIFSLVKQLEIKQNVSIRGGTVTLIG